LPTEPERYLRKSRESLASARADVRAERHNSAANRAYYAAFQAAVAALIDAEIRPQEDWEHRFVASQFSGKLVKRRKLYASRLAGTLERLFELRITADYRPSDVSAKEAERATKLAEGYASEIETNMSTKRLREAAPAYEATAVPKMARPADYVRYLKTKILEHYPELEFETHKRGPRDFTLKVYGDREDLLWDVQDAVGDLRSDILVDHDVWIVFSPRRPAEDK
jgi:uncharacterized protein (UPF0332 family)